MKYFWLITLSLLLTFSAFAQSGKVSSKTGIKKGVLKNGLTYYLSNNPLSKGKVNFYLVQDVGAILEEDSQAGLAHFLEHMAFNGTKHFPKTTITEKFEAKGLNFSINAYTGVDQTVYHFTNIPSNDRAFNDECLLILHDWCNNLTLSPEAIENERPVILEEMRTRNNLSFRVNETIMPVLFNDTKYAKRNIIGPAEVIKNFDRKELVDFYQTWYRTDLQAVVVIGDIDVLDMETKLKNLFSSLPEVENPKERYHIDIPDNTEILFAEARDKELTSASVRISVRHNYSEDVEENFEAALLNDMLAKRVRKLLKEEKDKGQEQSVSALSMSFAPIAYKYGNYAINIEYKEGMADQAMNTALGMQKHLMENGFTQEEFDHSKKRMRKGLEAMKKMKGYTSNELLFENIKRNFINKMDILDADARLKSFDQLMQKLSLKDIQNKLVEWNSGPNKSILVFGGEEDELLSKQQVLDFESNCEPLNIVPELDDEEDKEVNKDALVAEELKGSPIVKTEKLSDLLAEKWTLENGATVIFKENDANRNLISLYATSLGGFSGLEGEALANAFAFNRFVTAFGVKGYSAKEFEELLKLSNITNIPKLAQKYEEIHSMAEYENVETLFQLLYNRFENMELYEDKFDEIYQKMGEELKKKTITHQHKLSDTISFMRYGNKKYIPLDDAWYQSITAERLKELYQDRYQDASSFEFYIVGGIGKSRAKKLAQQYIGSIKTTGKKEAPAFVENKLEAGKRLKKTFEYEIPGNKAGIIYNMDLKADYSFKNNLCYNIIKIHLQNELQNQIRQQARGTYGVSVKNRLENFSTKNCNFEVRFECDPERTEELDEMLHETIMSVSTKGMSQADFDIIKKMLDRPQSPPNKNNSYYISVLKEHLELGTNNDEKDFYKEQLDSIDLDYTNTALKELSQAAILDIIYVPK